MDLYIDMVEREPRQAGVDLVQQVIAARAGIVGALAHRPHALGRDHHLVALDAQRLERAADEFLALPGGVEVGGVDEVDPAIERLFDQRGRAVLVEIVLEEAARLVATVIAPMHAR